MRDNVSDETISLDDGGTWRTFIAAVTNCLEHISPANDDENLPPSGYGSSFYVS